MDIRPVLSALSRHKTAAALIVVEIALTCAIICNAMFLISQRIDKLSEPSGLVEDQVLEISLAGIGEQADKDARTAEDLAALRAIPGVTDAVVGNQVPFFDNSNNTGLGLVPNQANNTVNAAQYQGDTLVKTLGLRLVAGRDFLPDEILLGSAVNKMLAEHPEKVSSAVIVTQSLARKLFPDGPAIGKTIYTGNIPLTIVGVVETLARPNIWGADSGKGDSIILPVRLPYTEGFYFLRVADPGRRQELLKAAVDTLTRLDPNRLVLRQRTYEEIRGEYFRNDRAMVGLMIVVCVSLMVVTALGIVGLASFWVQQRTKQIGIRRALGATRGQVLRYFQTENFLLASIGIVLGMLLAYSLNQMLMGRYELPRLPLAYLPVGAVLLWLLGQISVLGPARRAAAVPPAVATRGA
ncbi:ABC transporter permease [[Pseudomonas] boreopolis]|uniref:ABC transporter permease n=1 Tax=Xanthomonas boreopolis TaxID=86183 RepID=UPI003D4AE172